MATPIFNENITPDDNIKALIEEQKDTGATVARPNGWQPFPVLIAKAVFNAEQKAESASGALPPAGQSNVTKDTATNNIMGDLNVGVGRTLDVSAGTLTLADGQIPVAKVSGAVSETILESYQRYAAGGFGLRATQGRISAMGSGDSQIRVLFWGDSMSTLGDGGFPLSIATKIGQAYGDLGTGGTTGFTGSAGINATSYTFWPSGITYYTETGGTISYGSGGVGGLADKLKVYYIKASGAGTFKVQSSTNNGSSWSDEAGYTSVDANDPTTQLGIITISKTLSTYMLRVVGLSGHVDFLPSGLGQLRVEGISGASFASIAEGGLTLPDANSSSGTILAAWLADYQPTLGFYEMKESSAVYVGGALTTFQSRMNAGAPLMDWVFILSTPNQTGTADQLLENEALRAHAYAGGYAWLDFYGLYRDWADADDLGYMADGVHRTALGNQALVGYTISQLSLDQGYGAASSASVSAPSVIAKTRFAFAGEQSLPRDFPLLDMVVKSGTGNQDVEARINRALILSDSAGNSAWGFNPSNANYYSYTPNIFMIGGTSGVLVRGVSNTQIFLQGSAESEAGVKLTVDTFSSFGNTLLYQETTGLTLSMSNATPVGAITAYSGSLHLRRDTGQVYRHGGAGTQNNTDWIDMDYAAGLRTARTINGVSFDGTANITVPSQKLTGYTVGTLPVGTVGDTAYVTDALTPVAGTTITGGGALIRPVFFDGSNWVSMY